MNNDTKRGVWYEGVFYEFGSLEYQNLMLIEGKKEDLKDTLLGLISKIETEDDSSIINKN